MAKQSRAHKFRDCVICGKTFRIFSGSVITCGKACSKARKRDTENERKRASRGASGQKPCVICGEMFSVWGTQKTCGDDCRRVMTRNSRDKDKQRELQKRWLSIPENKAKVQESRRKYEERRRASLSQDERRQIEEQAKKKEYEKQRREKRKADKLAAAKHREQVAEHNRRKRLRMTPEDVEEYRKKKREEQRRYRTDPVKRQVLNNRKRDAVRRRNAESFSGVVMKVMTVLSNTLSQEIQNEHCNIVSMQHNR